MINQGKSFKLMNIEKLMNKPTIVENYADNGAFSHYSCINSDTGDVLWEEDELNIFNKIFEASAFDKKNLEQKALKMAEETG
jgi:outer membrane protein assembly factor BamB